MIHREELDSQPDTEMVLQGNVPREIAVGFLTIPTPGHTRGHIVLLVDNRFLFTGNHLYFDRTTQRLAAFRDYCWYSWQQQVESMRRLAEFEFDGVLPGHGQRVQLPKDEMRRQVRELVEQMALKRE